MASPTYIKHHQDEFPGQARMTNLSFFDFSGKNDRRDFHGECAHGCGGSMQKNPRG